MRIIHKKPTKFISLFLAFILTAGTITGFFPLLSLSRIDAHAIKDIEKDKIDCNNVNINLNGLDIDAIPEPLITLLKVQTDTKDKDGGGTSNLNEKDFSFVCLNNNDNKFIIIPPTIPTLPIEGLLDLAVANFGSDNISIFLNDGEGNFTQTAGSPIMVGDGPIFVTVGDFDGDGILDLAVSNTESDNISILLNDGKGNFTQPAESPIMVGDSPESVTVGDFDGNGILDLAVANLLSDSVSILLGDGDGTFTQAPDSPITIGPTPTAPIYVAIGDFDGNGILDLAVANGFSDNISILLGDGDGTFTQAPDSPLAAEDEPISVAVGDFDGDRVLDLAVANFFSDNLSVFLGDGDGTFTQSAESPIMVGDGPRSVAVGDFDGDGILDLAVTNLRSDNISILLGDGDGTFTQSVDSPITVGDGPFSVAVGDLNERPVEIVHFP